MKKPTKPKPRITKALLERVARERYGPGAMVKVGRYVGGSRWCAESWHDSFLLRDRIVRDSKGDAMRALMRAMGAG